MKYMLIFLFLFGNSFADNQLPSYIQVCNRKHTDVAKCIIKNIEIVRPKLKGKDGVRELGLPSLNPLVIPHAELKIGQTFKAKLDNLKIDYAHEAVVEDLKIDFVDGVNIDLSLKYPRIFASFDHHVSGKLLILTLDGSGPGSIKFDNLTLKIVLAGKLEKKKGRDHIVIKSIGIKSEIGRMDLKLDNLFPKNPELTENANKILNDNQIVLIEEISPVIVNIFKELVGRALTYIFDRYSMDVLLPND